MAKKVARSRTSRLMAAVVTMFAIPWTDIIAVIGPMIAACLAKGQTPAQILQSLQNPGPFARRRASVALGEKISRPVWRKHKDEIMAACIAEAQHMTEADVLELAKAA